MMKALLVVVGVLAVAATAQAETFRRAGSACQTKSTTWSFTSYGLGIKNTSALSGMSLVCPIDAIGDDASNLIRVRVKFQVPSGTAPQCTIAVSDVKGSTFWKYTLNAPFAADGFPEIDFGTAHAPVTATSTMSMQCSVGAGQSLLYYTYEDQ